MATEVKRTDYGVTDKGPVTVIEKQSYDDSGNNLVSTFEVRHGVRTVEEGISTFTRADRLARAITGALG